MKVIILKMVYVNQELIHIQVVNNMNLIKMNVKYVMKDISYHKIKMIV